MHKQYVDFLDRFDGGGAGQTGDSFQGGGLFSALGNLFANPYGSEDQARRAQRRQALGLLDTAAAPPQARPAPFAPPRGNITTSVLPPAIPAHLTGPKMGMPPQIPSHLTGPKMGMPPQIPSHLTGPKMGMPPQAIQYPWQGDAQFVRIMQQEYFPNPDLAYLKNDPQRVQNMYEAYLKYAQQ